MIATILGLFTSSGFGAVIGMVGSWLTKREERENLKVKYDHDRQMAALQNAEAEQERKHALALADKKMEIAETEGKIQTDILESEAFKESIKGQSKSAGIFIVEAVKGFMRPLITVYLLGIMTYISIKIWGLAGGLDSLSPETTNDIFLEIIRTVMFLASTSITWWFGARPPQKRK